MNYLIYNTAGRTTEILLSANGKEEYFSDENGLQASSVLLPATEDMLCRTDSALNAMDFFGCVIGPGSFTGIRIGVVTVKTLCYALGKKAAAINYNRLVSLAAAGKRLAVVYGWADVYYAAVYDGKLEIAAPEAFKKDKLIEFIETHKDFILTCDDRSHAAFGGIKADERECMRIFASSAELLSGEEIEPLYAMQSQSERELKK